MRLHATCPRCGHEFTCHDGVTDPAARPKPGDVSICGACSALGIYTDDLQVRSATEAEDEDLRARPAIQAALTALASTSSVHGAVAVARHLNERSN